MRRLGLSLLVLLLSGVSWASPASSAEPTQHVVQAGAIHPTDPVAPYEFTRYYPERLKVHRGDTVRFDLVGFHTVTFFGPEGRAPFVRPDEAPGSFVTDERWALSTCGRDSAPACVLTGDDRFLSSGVPFVLEDGPFRLGIDAPTGVYRFNCTVHPSMEGQLEVVDDAVPLPSAASIASQRAEEIAQDAAAADAFVERQEPRSDTVAGRRVWQVNVGGSTPDNHVAILSYLGLPDVVEPDDAVHFAPPPGVVDEVHTVTFPGQAVGGFTPVPTGLGGFGFYAQCDLDSRTSGLSGIPGPWYAVTPTKCPVNVELGLGPWMIDATRAPGDEVRPGTYHDSAMLVPQDAPDEIRELPRGSGRRFASSFDAVFPVAGEYTFACNVHPDFMKGAVRVG
ncbi:MAG TPA: hypothetical protein VM840_06635 [Actinomycetota bacterium]|nr:hypothetical protein [Actinomycetota bacterium]